MGAFEITEMVQSGIKHIENWLLQNGYTLTGVEAWQHGSADIKADGPGANIFIQAQTVAHPGTPALLSGTDKFAVKDIAQRQERVPYIAYLVIDHDKNLVGDILWERIG